MSRIKQIDKQLSALGAAKQVLIDERVELMGKTLLECWKCHKKTQVGLLTYIQTRYYTEPYGCTGGDYWSDGEGQYICPKCGELNRPIWNNPRIIELKRYFKEIVKKHDD
jgi:hypothetical protein